MKLGKAILPISLALAVSGGPEQAAAASQGPKEAAHAFIEAGDRQDAERLEQLLHPNFRVLFVTAGKPGESDLSRAQYLDLVRAKKLGGDERKVEIVSAEVHDRMAFLRLRIQGKQATFNTLETLVQVGERWQLVSDHVVFSPHAPSAPAK